jgi:hypothetical protein
VQLPRISSLARRPPTRLLAGAAFAVYLAGLAAAFGRGAIVVVGATAVVGAVVAAAMWFFRPTFSWHAFSRPTFPRPTFPRPTFSPPAFSAPSVGPEARRTAAHALRIGRGAAQEALRALGHGRVRAAAVAADLPKLLPAAPTAPRQVAQLRLDWRLRQAQQLNRTGAAARRAGRAAEAVAAHRRAVEIYREADDGRREALTLSALGLAEAHLDPDAAVASFEAALEILRRVGDTRTEGQVLANLGVVHHRVGRDDAAYRCWADALPRLDPASPEHARLAERLQLAS